MVDNCMITDELPDVVPNWINGYEELTVSKNTLHKLNPADGTLLCEITKSSSSDVQKAIDAAKAAQPEWAGLPPVIRGEKLHSIAMEMKKNREIIARIVHLETGKSFKDALGETDGAISLALFYAGEGQRLYGRTCTSGVQNKYAMTIRQPIGVAGLIISANTPIANVAWKVFPALICGNSVVLKASSDTPVTAWIVGKIAHNTGLPLGVFNILQGRGEEVGSALVQHPDVGVISFTGSTEVGKNIAVECGKRLARVSLELGGKNPLIVCDDADLTKAAHWVVLSAFSNAGQRCASASRIIVFESIYSEFRKMLLDKISKLKIGTGDTDDLGPVINERQLCNILDVIDRARKNGAKVLIGGRRVTETPYNEGFYIHPTLIENVFPDDEISRTELFGPVCCLYRVEGFTDAINLANDSDYGLTSCIHTKNIDRAISFTQKIQSGVAVINGGTYGSEPHMPFGGVKQSGNGSREPGTEALDVYSELRDIYIISEEMDN